ncbi:monofunctional biosynthetic peptidoglycan transglycosylase, partial [Pontibacterium sp.]|uniref:monofunctional biosynthetic peptidoglycan transglycosylase n=1 Tax=Pontibacterium sp. TaxID=2036026 RepID=UPI0035631850
HGYWTLIEHIKLFTMLKKPLKALSYLCATFLGIILLLMTTFKWVNIPTSAFMITHNIKHVFNNKKEAVKFEWIDIEDIPLNIQLAVIASEDQKFPSHHGVDFQATSEAVTNAIQGKKSRGGSTITQQVVKNLFLWEGRSYVRKALEIPLAMLLELIWDKRRILEVYLNIAQFGVSDYGIKRGSIYQLNKPIQHINHYDAALLAAVLPAPSQFKARLPSPRLAAKQANILRQLRRIDHNKYLAALK